MYNDMSYKTGFEQMYPILYPKVCLPFSGICCRIGDSRRFSAVFTRSSNCGFFCSNSRSTFCGEMVTALVLMYHNVCCTSLNEEEKGEGVTAARNTSTYVCLTLLYLNIHEAGVVFTLHTES